MPFNAGRGWAIALVAALLCGSALAYLGYLTRNLPAAGDRATTAKSIVVYGRDGSLLAERNSNGQFHVYRSLDQMGRYGPAATLAAEDRGFFQHGAVDPTSVVRAALTDLGTGSAAQGGSTITQQLVKIDALSPQKSLDRKFQEALLAWAMEHRYSKSQVLEMYLNRVYYGHGAYGLASATKTFFGSQKEPRDLTVAQAALLAGLIQAPYGNDPQTHWDRARARQLYVLHGMESMGVINSAEEQAADKEDIASEIRYDTAYRAEPAPHFVDWVIAQLEARLGAAAVQSGGYVVRTTLDPNLQALAEQSVAGGVQRLAGRGINNADLLAARPDTGEILAFVGSADYASNAIGGQYDVITSPRQPGSSFKPYVYAAALNDHRIALCTQLQDRPTDFNGYRPLDFDNSWMGPMSARRALLLSRNVPAVAVAKTEGIGRVIDLAHALGIRSNLDPSLPTAIGASEVTMFDQVQAYQALANQGWSVPLIGITNIRDRNGDTVYSTDPGHQDGIRQVLPSATTYLVADVLKGYAAQWNLGWKRTLAGKSGTSGGSQLGVHPDSWMMAYSPDVVIGAWAGNTGADGAGKPTSAFGTEVGSTITATFVNGLPSTWNRWYSAPPGVVQKNGELFLSGTENQAGCSGPGGNPGHGNGKPPEPAPDQGQGQEGD